MSHASSTSTLPPGAKSIRGKVFWSGIAVILFFAAVALKAVWPEGEPGEGAASALSAQCHNVSSLKVLHCPIESGVESNWFKPAEGTKVNGMNLCFDPAEFVTVESKIENGTTFMRFRTKDGVTGKHDVSYKLMDLKGAPMCPSEF